jgi:hypothetical protein
MLIIQRLRARKYKEGVENLKISILRIIVKISSPS